MTKPGQELDLCSNSKSTACNNKIIWGRNSINQVNNFPELEAKIQNFTNSLLWEVKSQNCMKCWLFLTNVFRSPVIFELFMGSYWGYLKDLCIHPILLMTKYTAVSILLQLLCQQSNKMFSSLSNVRDYKPKLDEADSACETPVRTRRHSWRQQIFLRVATPQKGCDSPSWHDGKGLCQIHPNL